MGTETKVLGGWVQEQRHRMGTGTKAQGGYRGKPVKVVSEGIFFERTKKE